MVFKKKAIHHLKMRKKTASYFLIILVLLGCNLYLLFTNHTVSPASFNDRLFLIKDTAAIWSIIIENEKAQVRLTQTKEGWRLNDRHAVDKGFLKTLLSIFNRVKIKRKVGVPDTKISGRVNIQLNDGGIRKMAYINDPLRTKTFFVQNGQGYLVEVPGYSDNVANIFELTVDQWRDRTVLDGSWRTIQLLTLTMPKEELRIAFKDSFFDVRGVQPVDSNAVVDYLNQFQAFQANEMVSKGEFPSLDSLLKTPPLAVLSIQDISKPEPTTLTIYSRLPNQSYHLVTNNQGDMMVFNSSRMEQILKSPAAFKAK